jgi:hypothetical protein
MLHSVRELFRFRILASDGKVGKTDDFFFAEPSWAIQHVVVNTGRWLPANRVLVSLDMVRSPDPATRLIAVAMTRAAVLNSAGTETAEPISHQQERLLRERFGAGIFAHSGAPRGAMHGVAEGQAVALAEAERSQRGTTERPYPMNLRSAREVLGYQIEATDGPQGVIDDFLLDDDEWAISYIVVNTKDVRLPNPRVLVPPSWVQDMSWSETRVHMRVNREKIKRSQRYDPVSHSHTPREKPLLWP